MFLEYAVDKHGALIHVSRTPRGKTVGLFCPYCGADLIARKGEILAHHYAHAGDTCRPVSRDDEIIRLPMYERFSLSIVGRDWKALKYFHDKRKLPRKRWLFDRLYNQELIQYDYTTKRHELTYKGRIPFGEATLAEFAPIQDDLMQVKHTELSQHANSDYVNSDETTIATNDLRLYRAQLRRVHSALLYLLDVQHSAGQVYKIGVTTRTLDERITEIERDLQSHFQQVKIAPILTLANRGAVEPYFKFCFKREQVAVGNLTEYFTFTNIDAIIDELHTLGNRPLSEFDTALLSDTGNDWQ